MSSYADSMFYEHFIRRAFKCGYNGHNSKNSYFQNLINTENGAGHTKHLGSYEKQLVAIKKNINKAIDRFLKSKPNEEERNNLLSFQENLELAHSTSEILSLLVKAVRDTSRFREL